MLSDKQRAHKHARYGLASGKFRVVVALNGGYVVENTVSGVQYKVSMPSRGSAQVMHMKTLKPLPDGPTARLITAVVVVYEEQKKWR